MKFDVQIPSLNGTARVEIRTARAKNLWAAYIGFAADRSSNETCFVLGQNGIPYRFTGASEKEAAAAAKSFLEENYRVVRTIW
ncbi:MAG: hypothetical protein ACREQK_14850 [Candidatus Binatia bacterium]|jgi:hypothetical protein